MSENIGKLRLKFEPLLRRLFHLYWRIVRGMTLGVRGVVLDQNNRVFLVKHSYVAGWHLPGGGVEAGETIGDALARELEEEGGIALVGAPLLHGVFFNARISRRDHVAVYVVRDFVQQGGPRHAHEIIDHGFFAPDALPADATRGTRARLDEVLKGAAVSQRW